MAVTRCSHYIEIISAEPVWHNAVVTGACCRGGVDRDWPAYIPSPNCSGGESPRQGFEASQKFYCNSNLGELTTSTIVQISERPDKAESVIDADEAAILSQGKFFASGQITHVTPRTGEAGSFDLYVRSLGPTNTGLSLRQIAAVDLSEAEKYYIYWMRNPMTEFLFNSSAPAFSLRGRSFAAGNGCALKWRAWFAAQLARNRFAACAARSSSVSRVMKSGIW